MYGYYVWSRDSGLGAPQPHLHHPFLPFTISYEATQLIQASAAKKRNAESPGDPFNIIRNRSEGGQRERELAEKVFDSRHVTNPNVDLTLALN